VLSGASTPPRLRVRRRSRYLTIPASVLLAACMSVPAVQCGGEQLYPYHLPVATWPHVAGLVVAIQQLCLGSALAPAALVRAERWTLGAIALALGMLAWFTVVGLIAQPLTGLAVSIVCAAGLLVGSLVQLGDLARATNLPRAALRGARPGGGEMLFLLTAFTLAVTGALALVPASRPPPPPTNPYLTPTCHVWGHC
jgi:hypothetical protein